MNTPPPEDLLPLLFVLGALDAAQHRALAHRRAHDPVLDQDITQWEIRLAPLALAAPPATPSAGLWARIEAGIDEVAQTPAPPGVAATVIRRHPDGSSATTLVRLAAGTSPRDIAGLAGCTLRVIAGTLRHAGATMHPGDECTIPQAAPPPDLHAEEAAVLLLHHPAG